MGNIAKRLNMAKKKMLMSGAVGLSSIDWSMAASVGLERDPGPQTRAKETSVAQDMR